MRNLCSAAVLLLLVVLRITPSCAQGDDSITYQGVTVRPGDVINFQGGGATTGSFLIYGHTSLYLGTDPQTKQKTFLDFSTTKGGSAELIFGSPRAFSGRLLREVEFLSYNGRYHQGFDVFRLKDPSLINQTTMIQEAKRIAAKESWGPLTEVCSSAVAVVLSKATGTAINVKTPDGFTGGLFQKHPDLRGKSISIQAAFSEVRKALTDDKASNSRRIGVIERDRAAAETTLGQVQDLIREHNANRCTHPPGQSQLCDAYNARAAELGRAQAELAGQLTGFDKEKEKLRQRNKEIDEELN